MKAIELVQGTREKHDLILASKLIEDFIVDRARDAGLRVVQENLQKRGMAGSAQISSLGKFLIDYGYNSMRFYLAWSNVHDILAQMDDRNALASALQRNIVETTQQMSALRSEVQRLKEARDHQTGSVILAELRQKEMREAYFAGEWFSQRTGFRASGEPIIDR